MDRTTSSTAAPIFNTPLVSKIDLAERLLEKWGLQHKGETSHCLVGFDGFVDEIVIPVQERTSFTTFVPFPTISSISERIAQASGKSCNIELMVREKKIGGNAPILALALVEGGHQITLVGTLGKEEISPIFHPLTERCFSAVSIGPSGHSDALEFADGKIILGKLNPLNGLQAEEVVDLIGLKRLEEWLERSTLFVSANWTMLPMMNQFWELLIEKILPRLSSRKRIFFVDLADPAKRPQQDLLKALDLLKGLQTKYQVVLGLNRAEAERIRSLSDLPETLAPEESIGRLRSALGLSQVVVHTPRSAMAATEEGVFYVESAFTSTPRLNTGAGDNFNAGYCNALLYNMTANEALLTGVATAGYYVREGRSPTMEELADFLCRWEKGLIDQA